MWQLRHQVGKALTPPIYRQLTKERGKDLLSHSGPHQHQVVWSGIRSLQPPTFGGQDDIRHARWTQRIENLGRRRRFLCADYDFPSFIFEASGIQISGLRESKVDLRAANNAKIDVQGVTDATNSALSPSGKRFKTTSRVYIIRNVDKLYLPLDVLVGLKIVNGFFPVAGAGNQNGAQAGAWDRTGTVTEQLPHASYSIKVDGSSRISQRTRQHLTTTQLVHPTATLLRLVAKETFP